MDNGSWITASCVHKEATKAGSRPWRAMALLTTAWAKPLARSMRNARAMSLWTQRWTARQPQFAHATRLDPSASVNMIQNSGTAPFALLFNPVDKEGVIPPIHSRFSRSSSSLRKRE